MGEITFSKKHQLSAQLQQAAKLDALGHSVNEIAKVTGIDRTTIGRHRNHDSRYQELVRQHAAEALSNNALVIGVENARLQSIHALKAATETLIEMLEATQDGVPNWDIRWRAAKILYNSPVARQMFQVSDDIEGKAQVVVPAQTLTIRLEGREDWVIEDAELLADPEPAGELEAGDE